MFDLDEFIKSPTPDAFSAATRDDLVRVAGHYKIEVRGSPSKAELLDSLTEALGRLCIFTFGDKVQPVTPPAAPDPPITPMITKAALELRRLELREKEIEWERERTRLEADRQTVREREKRDHELRLRDMELPQAIRLKELDLKARESGFSSHNFDVTRNIRLVRMWTSSLLILRESLRF